MCIRDRGSPVPTTEPTRTSNEIIQELLSDTISSQMRMFDLFNSMERRILRIEAIQDQLRQEEYMPETLILNVTQAAKALGVSRTTLYKLVESGRLPARKFATSEDTEPRTVILSEDLKTFLAELPSAEGQPAS